MSNSKRNKQELLILSILLAVITALCLNNTNSDSFLIDNNYSKYPKSSNSDNIIHVVGNWTETEATYGWCTGSGTYSDPYVIEDLNITGTGMGTAILIENTTEYFRIENCSFNYFENGIYLKNAGNATIYNNSISDCDYGIYLNPSQNNTIEENIMFGVNFLKEIGIT